MSNRIHHLNCATFHPPLGRFESVLPQRLVAHCLLVESADGLTLVDTGLGTADLADPFGRLGRPFVKVMGAVLETGETAVNQVERLGFAARDVRNIVLTHLDCDHAGGIGDFPAASVHVFGEELDAARRRASLTEKGRYVPAQWSHNPSWVEHAAGGDSWFGFASVKLIGDDVVLVPLPGHTRGHCAVGVRRPGGGWFLHCGDAYFFHHEKSRPASCPPGLRVFQRVVEMNRTARLGNQERLRELHATHSDEVTLFSAHDATEYDALASSVG